MENQILIWINTAIDIFAVIVMAITMRASWQAHRDIQRILPENLPRHDDIKRRSLATLERLGA